MREVVVSRWIKPKGYDLAVCEINSSMFVTSLVLIYGKFDEFKRFVRDRDNYDCDHDNACAMYVTVKTEGEIRNYILIQQNEWRATDYGTICHELHHFTHRALSNIGIEYGAGGEELFAYFQGYFMEVVIKAFVELKKSKKYKTK